MLHLKVEKEKIAGVEKYWGDRMPMMAMEEVGELIQAISKMERHPNDVDCRKNLIEEIRDVYISLMALQYRYCISMSRVNEEINEKLNNEKDS